MSTKHSITIIKLIILWQSLKLRREALNLTQPEMASAIDVSLSAYTHYEASAEKLTVERLMQLDGKISMLEKAADNSGGKPVDNLGIKSGQKQPHRIQKVLPKDFPLRPTAQAIANMLTGKH